MKKLILILAMACAALVSCNKDDAETSIRQEALLENLQGKWSCIEVDTYLSEEAYKNGNRTGHIDCEEGGYEALVFDGEKIFTGDDEDGVLTLGKNPFEIESNDGKKIVTKPMPGDEDGTVYYVIRYLGDEKVQSVKRISTDKCVHVLTYIRTDREIVFM